MKVSSGYAIGVLVSLFVLVLVGALSFNSHFPVLVFAGENSVGTWMSGVLLIFCAAICLSISMTKRWYPWLPLTLFFFLLAFDERFMIHERIKEWILFSSVRPSRWLYELPVVIGAVIGGIVALIVWRHTRGGSRLLLLAAVVCGLASVAIDILAAGVLLEECFKLLAELLVASLLLRTHSRATHSSS
ncbi:MAG TPA: hypothetical protein VGD65_02745 [Chryseosolibacter sp.]